MVAEASWTPGSADDGWGPSTSVRSTSAQPGGAAPHAATPVNGHAPRGSVGTSRSAARPGSRSSAFDDAFSPRPATNTSARERIEAMSAGAAKRERGTAGWLALLALIVITVLGLLVDSLRGEQLGTGFNVGIIAGAVVAILIVRRSGMFPVVVAPPIVYSLGAGISLYVRSDGLARRNVLIDAAANWLVYGFPAIAAATAAVLIIAGIRLITHR